MSAPRLNPYVGLVPYTERDADWFYGREREIQLVIANLRTSRLTLLYGASGVGKSSILLAGVLPRLRALVAEHRASAPLDASGVGLALDDRAPIAVTVFRDWRDAPLPRLVAAIDRAVEEATGVPVEPWDGREPLVARLRRHTTHVRTLLLVLDQFEEYFTYHPAEAGERTFADELPAILGEPDLRVNVVLSLREDALSTLDRFKGRIAELFGNYLRIPYLDRAAARQAILAPVERYNGLRPDGGRPVRVDDALVETVLDEVRTGHLALAERQGITTELDAGPARDAAGQIETPYLQLVMERLWNEGTAHGGHELTLETLEKVGGADAIVSRHLTDAVSDLSPGDQAIAADVFGLLVTPSRTKIAHRASDLAILAGHPEPDVRRVLRTLSSGEHRILRSVPPPGREDVERYELFHDVLADAVLEWAKRTRHARHLAAERRARRIRSAKRLALVVGAACIAAALWSLARSIGDDDSPRERASRLASESRAALDVDPERSLLLAVRALDEADVADARRSLVDAVVASRAGAAYAVGPLRRCAADCTPRPDRPEPAAPTLYALDDTGDASRPVRLQTSALSPDARAVAVVRDGAVRLWRPAAGTADKVAGSDGAQQVAFAGERGRLLVLTGAGRALLLPSAGGGRPRVLVGAATAVALSADARFAAFSGARRGQGGEPARRVTLAPVTAGEKRTLLVARPVEGLAFSPVDAGLVVAVTAERLYFWRWRDGTRTSVALPAPSAEARFRAAVLGGARAAVRFSPDGRLAFTANGDIVRAWDVRTRDAPFTRRIRSGWLADTDSAGRSALTVERNVATIRSVDGTLESRPLGGHEEAIQDGAFSPDGTLVATAAADGTARVWDVATGSSLLELRAPGPGGRTAVLTRVEFAPDGEWLLTTDDGGLTRWWSISSGAVFPRPGVAGAAFDVDRRRVLVALVNGRVRRWEPVAAAELGPTVARLPTRSFGAELAPAGGIGAALPDDAGSAIVFRLGGRGRFRVGGPPAFVARLSADGRRLMTGDDAGMRVWDVSGDRPQLIRKVDDTLPVAISDDGRRAVVRLLGDHHHVVDADTGRRVAVLRGTDGVPTPFADFDARGERVLTADGRDAVVWGARTGRRERAFSGHVGRVLSGSFSADGRRIVTGGADRTIRLWEAHTGRQLAVLGRHATGVTSVQLSPSEDAVLSTGEDGTLRVTRCEVCRPIEELRAIARRRLAR